MVEVQIRPLENPATILARIVIPLEDVMAGELDLLLGQAIKEKQDDDSRHPDVQRNAVEHDRFRRTDREIAPACEIVREVVLVGVRIYDLCMAFVEKIEGAASAANVDSLPQPIEDEDRAFQDALHAEQIQLDWPDEPGKLKPSNSTVNQQQDVL